MYERILSNTLAAVEAIFEDMASRPGDSDHDYLLGSLGGVITREAVNASTLRNDLDTLPSKVIKAFEVVELWKFLPPEKMDPETPHSENFLRTRRPLFQIFLAGWIVAPKGSELESELNQHLLAWPAPSPNWKGEFETDVGQAMSKCTNERLKRLVDAASPNSNQSVVVKALQTRIKGASVDVMKRMAQTEGL